MTCIIFIFLDSTFVYLCSKTQSIGECNKRSKKKPLLNSHSFVDTLFNMQTHRGYSSWWYSNFSQTWNLSRSNSRNFWRLQPTYIKSSICRHIGDTVCDGIQTFLRLKPVLEQFMQLLAATTTHSTYIKSSTCTHIGNTVCDDIQTFLRLAGSGPKTMSKSSTPLKKFVHINVGHKFAWSFEAEMAI